MKEKIEKRRRMKKKIIWKGEIEKEKEERIKERIGWIKIIKLSLKRKIIEIKEWKWWWMGKWGEIEEKKVIDFMKNMLGKIEWCGEIEEEKIDERRKKIWRILIKKIVEGWIMRIDGKVIIEREKEGIGKEDIIKEKRIEEILDWRMEEIIGIDVGDRKIGRVEIIIMISGENKGEIILIRNGEDDEKVVVMEEIGERVGKINEKEDMDEMKKKDIVKLKVELKNLKKIVGKRKGGIEKKEGV